MKIPTNLFRACSSPRGGMFRWFGLRVSQGVYTISTFKTNIMTADHQTSPNFQGYIYNYTYIRTHTHTDIYMYIYIYVYAHVYIHTEGRTCSANFQGRMMRKHRIFGWFPPKRSDKTKSRWWHMVVNPITPKITRSCMSPTGCSQGAQQHHGLPPDDRAFARWQRLLAGLGAG